MNLARKKDSLILVIVLFININTILLIKPFFVMIKFVKAHAICCKL